MDWNMEVCHKRKNKFSVIQSINKYGTADIINIEEK